MKTINLNLSWADAKVENDGGVVLEIGALTPGGESVKVKVRMWPTSLGYLAETMHEAVAVQQKRLDEVKAKLRGGQA
jgi:hypothetical protein